jgi:hypothetical protein
MAATGNPRTAMPEGAKAEAAKAEAGKPETNRAETNKAESGKTSTGKTATRDAEAAKTAASEAALSSTARYVSPAEAVARARAGGAAGDLARINLEYDKKRSVPVWKVIFATATEYRFNALTGELLATKPKPSEGLLVLSPLTLSDRFLSFQAIIGQAERLTGHKASEMELKRVKGRSQTFFEVAMADGVTLFFDAVSGKRILEF